MNRKWIPIVAVAGLFVVGLIGLNRWQSQAPQRRLEAGEVAITLEGKTYAILTLEEVTALSQDFEAVYQRKVGPAEEHTYTGVAVATLLDYSGITLEPDQVTMVTAIDNYAIALDYDEVTMEGHSYLVIAQDGVPLDEESGPYMLVTAQDELSTRWNRQVVTIEVE